MPRIKLTKAAVERIRNAQYSRKIVYLDTDIRGLLLEYRPGGVGTWYFRAKDERRKSKMLRLGLLADMDVLEAKARAYEVQRFVEDRGKLGSMETHSGGRLTFGTFIEKYYLPHARARKRSWKTEVAYCGGMFCPYIPGRSSTP